MTEKEKGGIGPQWELVKSDLSWNHLYRGSKSIWLSLEIQIKRNELMAVRVKDFF